MEQEQRPAVTHHGEPRPVFLGRLLTTAGSPGTTVSRLQEDKEMKLGCDTIGKKIFS